MEEAELDIIARNFLDGGPAEGMSDPDLATACNRLIQQAVRRSLTEAIALAKTFHRRVRRSSSILQQTALRAVARTLHMSGRHGEAHGYYLKARALCRQEPLTRARIDRALIDVYMYTGDLVKARRAASSAMAVFRRLGATDDLAQTRVNWGNLLHRQDRHREAERLYRDAADYFASMNNRLAAARCYYNQANTLVQLFDMPAAERLYHRAIADYTEAGYALDACLARYGLAWLYMLSGKFHIALQELSSCEQIYREAGDVHREALCLLDRAEVYLNLGLYTDAVRAAAGAEKQFADLKLRYEGAKAALFRGQAALALGKKSEARRALRVSRNGFRQENNQGFLGASHLLGADMTGHDMQMRQRELETARRHFARAQLPYWAAMCDLYEMSQNQPARQVLDRLQNSKAIRAVPYLNALWRMALGDQAFRQHRLGEARRQWSRAADRLDSVRAQLPPIELRGAYGRRQPLPHSRLIAVEMDRRPLEAAIWSERHKTAGLWAPLSGASEHLKARQSAEHSLEKLALHVGTLSNQLWGSREAQLSATSRRQRSLTGLFRQIREEMLALEIGDAGVPSAPRLRRMFQTTSHRLPILQFHLLNGDIVAFIHHKGETHVHRFAGGQTRLAEDLRKWRFILEGELLASGHSNATYSVAEQALWADIGEWLWRPLEVDPKEARVLILPEGDLANLPWPALIAKKQVLGDLHYFILGPSLRHYLAAYRIQASAKTLEVFLGRAADLPQAIPETENLASLFGSVATIHNPCCRESWPSSGDSLAWHFVGHAALRTDNPFYSCLFLDDGPLFAADFRLKQCRVNMVTLSACRSGETVTLPGEESTGLVRSLLEMGARNVIASRWPVADHSAALWMQAFYESIVSGAAILEAVRAASTTVRRQFPSAYHWSAFALFGAGDLGGSYEM